MDYIEKNKQLATFMGYTYFPFTEGQDKDIDNGWKKSIDTARKSWYPESTSEKPYLCRCSTELKYHKSYDYLMPVIHRINTLQGAQVSIFKTYNSISVENGTRIRKDFSFAHSTIVDIDNPILSLYELVVKFVIWYNSQENK